MTELEKLLAHQTYNGADPEVRAYQADCRQKKAALDKIDPTDREAYMAALAELVGSMNGPAIIAPPFYTDFGKHIHLGHWTFVNTGATFLDSAPITLGDHVACGPNVQFITAGHPKRPEDRVVPRPGQEPPFDFVITCAPITVEAHAWIGAGAIILPGVTIGTGAVVGAGAVVTKDVPARMVAVGNPARVIGSVDDD